MHCSTAVADARSLMESCSSAEMLLHLHLLPPNLGLADAGHEHAVFWMCKPTTEMGYWTRYAITWHIVALKGALGGAQSRTQCVCKCFRCL